MDTNEINRYIHVEIMGKCWHNLKLVIEGRGRYQYHVCTICKEKNPSKNFLPDYCSDDSPRSLLNEVVAKLMEGRHSVSLASGYDPAEQIARACVEAHKAK